MAKQDLRIDLGFFEHHKTIRLKRELGEAGVISLLKLWIFAARNKPNGDLTGLDAECIAIAAGWDGDANRFVETLIRVGFLDVTEDGGYKLHDWEIHQPYLYHSAARSETARKLAEKRWGKRQSDGQCEMQCDTQCQRQCDTHNEPDATRNVMRNAPSPSPYPSPLKDDEDDDVVNARARDGEGAGVPSPPPPVGADGAGVPFSIPSETGVPSSGSSADNGTGVPSSGPWPVPSGQDADPVFAEIERTYFELTGRLCSPLDLQDITKTLHDAGGDAALIIRVMRRVAAEYKPKREGDRIRAFRYFREAILDELARQKARKEVKARGGVAKHPGKDRGQDRGIADLMEGPT